MKNLRAEMAFYTGRRTAPKQGPHPSTGAPSTANCLSMSVLDIVINLLAVAIWMAQYVLHYGLILFQYMLANFPQVTSFFMGLVLLYLAYRIVIRLIRFWYGMVVATVKTIMFLSLVVLCLTIYLRGWRFVEHDLPFLKDTILELVSDSATAKPKYLKMFFQKLQSVAFGQLFGKNHNSHKFTSGKYTNDYGIDIDESYFDYIDENFSTGDFDYGKIRDFVTNNLGTVEDYLRDQGIDLEHIGHNIAEGLANQFGNR
jgi:hypothetical protein